MKKLTLFILLLWASSPFAQNTKLIDSLEKALPQSTPLEKIDNLLRLSYLENSQKGLTHAQEAHALSVQEKQIVKQASALEYIAVCQRQLGDYPAAIDASLKALKIYENLELRNEAAILLAQLGAHFANDGNYEEAVPYLERAYHNFKQNQDTINITMTLINLGEAYRLWGKVDEAKTCFEECIALNNIQHSQIVQGYAEGNLGMTYRQLGKKKEAKENLLEAIRILTKLGDLYSVSVYQADLAKIYIEEKDSKKGEELLLGSLQIAKKEKLKEQIRDFSLDLAKFYEENNAFGKALTFRKQYEVYNDSLVNIANVRKIEKQHRRYLLEKKEKDIQLLEVENKFQHRIVLVLSISAILLLGLSLLLNRIQHQRKRAYIKVSEQKNIIEKRDEEKAVLLRELNHRVKNNLQMVASFLNLQARQYRNDTITAVLKAARLRIETLSLIHKKLYQGEVDGYVKLDDYLRELVQNLIFSFSKDVELKPELQPLFLHIDATIPLGIIVNELVTNSLKYATEDNENAQLTVSLQQLPDKVELLIWDNGPGYNADLARPQSLGLKLVKSLVQQIRGSISQENRDGCCWIISLKLDTFRPSTTTTQAHETN